MKTNGNSSSPGTWPRERFTEPPASSAPPSRSVLVYSTDPIQQRLLVLMLSRGGYEVQAESQINALLNLARSGPPAAVKEHQRWLELQRQLAYLQEQNHYLYHTFAPSSLEEQRQEAGAR